MNGLGSFCCCSPFEFKLDARRKIVIVFQVRCCLDFSSVRSGHMKSGLVLLCGIQTMKTILDCPIRERAPDQGYA